MSEVESILEAVISYDEEEYFSKPPPFLDSGYSRSPSPPHRPPGASSTHPSPPPLIFFESPAPAPAPIPTPAPAPTPAHIPSPAPTPASNPFADPMGWADWDSLPQSPPPPERGTLFPETAHGTVPAPLPAQPPAAAIRDPSGGWPAPVQDPVGSMTYSPALVSVAAAAAVPVAAPVADTVSLPEGVLWLGPDPDCPSPENWVTFGGSRLTPPPPLAATGFRLANRDEAVAAAPPPVLATGGSEVGALVHSVAPVEVSPSRAVAAAGDDGAGVVTGFSGRVPALDFWPADVAAFSGGRGGSASGSSRGCPSADVRSPSGGPAVLAAGGCAGGRESAGEGSAWDDLAVRASSGARAGPSSQGGYRSGASTPGSESRPHSSRRTRSISSPAPPPIHLLQSPREGSMSPPPPPLPPHLHPRGGTSPYKGPGYSGMASVSGPAGLAAPWGGGMVPLSTPLSTPLSPSSHPVPTPPSHLASPQGSTPTTPALSPRGSPPLPGSRRGSAGPAGSGSGVFQNPPRVANPYIPPLPPIPAYDPSWTAGPVGDRSQNAPTGFRAEHSLEGSVIDTHGPDRAAGVIDWEDFARSLDLIGGGGYSDGLERGSRGQGSVWVEGQSSVGARVEETQVPAPGGVEEARAAVAEYRKRKALGSV